jgi:hypothetical protein
LAGQRTQTIKKGVETRKQPVKQELVIANSGAGCLHGIGPGLWI